MTPVPCWGEVIGDIGVGSGLTEQDFEVANAALARFPGAQSSGTRIYERRVRLRRGGRGRLARYERGLRDADAVVLAGRSVGEEVKGCHGNLVERYPH